METGKTTIIPHDEPISVSASASSTNASRVETVARVNPAARVKTISTSRENYFPLVNFLSLTDLCRKVPSVQYLLEEC